MRHHGHRDPVAHGHIRVVIGELLWKKRSFSTGKPSSCVERNSHQASRFYPRQEARANLAVLNNDYGLTA
jgi:hypothetical protein